MKVLVTGAAGFLGWHTRCRLRTQTDHEIVAVDRARWGELGRYARGVDAIIHLAGVNRGSATEVAAGNLALAGSVAAAAKASGSTPRIVYANSIQSGNGTPYGTGKRQAGQLLAAAAADLGADYVEVVLPNLFGEYGRPRYNSFVATFVQAILDGAEPRIDDREIELLHAQGAAKALVRALDAMAGRIECRGTPTRVREVYQILREFQDRYSTGELPALPTELSVDLFNTLRAASFPSRGPIPLAPRVDHRGHLVEVVRVHGGPGQTFVSTTRPGVTRGDHVHLRKVERFVVLGGVARISLRRLLTNQVVSFDVSGRNPMAVDIPTGWAHNITNRGDTELTTLFWSNELFDPAAPDTFPEPVAPESTAAAAAGRVTRGRR